MRVVLCRDEEGGEGWATALAEGGHGPVSFLPVLSFSCNTEAAAQFMETIAVDVAAAAAAAAATRAPDAGRAVLAFTSRRSVRALASALPALSPAALAVLRSSLVFCLGHATHASVASLLGVEPASGPGEAGSAEALAALVRRRCRGRGAADEDAEGGAGGDGQAAEAAGGVRGARPARARRRVYFFCGNKRLDAFPDAVQSPRAGPGGTDGGGCGAGDAHGEAVEAVEAGEAGGQGEEGDGEWECSECAVYSTHPSTQAEARAAWEACFPAPLTPGGDGRRTTAAASSVVVVFFSPSGVRAVVEGVEGLEGSVEARARVVALGPTTAAAAAEAGLSVWATCGRPDPQGLLEALAALEER